MVVCPLTMGRMERYAQGPQAPLARLDEVAPCRGRTSCDIDGAAAKCNRCAWRGSARAGPVEVVRSPPFLEAAFAWTARSARAAWEDVIDEEMRRRRMCIDDIARDGAGLYGDAAFSCADSVVIITRRDLEEMTCGVTEFAILCRDTDKGIWPFLVAERGTYEEDIFDFDNPDDEGVAHVLLALPVPRHFHPSDDEGLLELSPCGPSVMAILQKFKWCVLAPAGGFEDGFELRFATLTMEDADFVADHFCVSPVVLPINDSSLVLV